MPTNYEPYDGDYIDADYTKLLNDAQTERGLDIGKYLEISVTLTVEDKLHVNCSNDEGTGWVNDYTFDIPANWDIELVRQMFEGYAVYLQPQDKEG